MSDLSKLPAWLDRRAYPFENRWLALRSGACMHYIDEGSGPTVLFVHGTPSWSFEWRHQIRALSSQFRCVAPDLIGMGLSDRPTNFSYTPDAHAAALREFVEALGLRDVTLVVHDFGGPIGLPLALDGSERVRRAIILNTFAWSLDDNAKIRRPAKLFSGALGKWLYSRHNFSLRTIMPAAYADRRKLTLEIHRQYLAPFEDRAARGMVLHAFARALLGSSPFYRSIAERLAALRRLPVLIVWGTKDPAFGVQQLTRWRAELPSARVVELPVGHWPQEEAPDEVSDAFHRFLSETRLAQPNDGSSPARPISPAHS